MKKILVYLSMLCFSVAACKRDDEVYSVGNEKGPPISGLLAIKSISRIQLEADSTTTTVIEFTVNTEADSANRYISLQTSLGKFLNGRTTDTLRINADGTAKASLLSNTTGTAMISARVKSINVDTTVSFTPSLPDDMLLSANNYVTDTTGSIMVSADLFRNPGRGNVSDPVKTFFTVTSLSGSTQALVYPQFAFSSNKSASITISNPFKATGQFRVDAKTPSAQGDTIRRNLVFTIQ
jgi:hypothetical protein